MQTLIEQGLAARLAFRNTPEHIRERLTLRFSLLYFFFFAAGLLLGRALRTETYSAINTYMETWLCHPFDDCIWARDYIRAILREARGELILLAMIAMGGMTMFAGRACAALLAVHAAGFGVICYGTAARVLYVAAPLSHGNLAFFTCFFTELLCAGILLAAATEAAMFSDRYRDACRTLRSRRDPLGARFILLILSLAGMLTVTVAARCLLDRLWSCI